MCSIKETRGGGRDADLESLEFNNTIVKGYFQKKSENKTQVDL